MNADEMDALEIEANRAEALREAQEEQEAEQHGEVIAPSVVDDRDDGSLPLWMTSF